MGVFRPAHCSAVAQTRAFDSSPTHSCHTKNGKPTVSYKPQTARFGYRRPKKGENLVKLFDDLFSRKGRNSASSRKRTSLGHRVLTPPHIPFRKQSTAFHQLVIQPSGKRLLHGAFSPHRPSCSAVSRRRSTARRCPTEPKMEATCSVGVLYQSEEGERCWVVGRRPRCVLCGANPLSRFGNSAIPRLAAI